MGTSLGKSGAYKTTAPVDALVDLSELDQQGKFSSNYYAKAYENNFTSLIASEASSNGSTRHSDMERSRTRRTSKERSLLHRHSSVVDSQTYIQPESRYLPPELETNGQPWVYSTLPKRASMPPGASDQHTGSTEIMNSAKSWNSNEVGQPLGAPQSQPEDRRVCHWLRNVNEQLMHTENDRRSWPAQVPRDPGEESRRSHASTSHVNDLDKKSRPTSFMKKSDIFKILRKKRKAGQIPECGDRKARRPVSQPEMSSKRFSPPENKNNNRTKPEPATNQPCRYITTPVVDQQESKVTKLQEPNDQLSHLPQGHEIPEKEPLASLPGRSPPSETMVPVTDASKGLKHTPIENLPTCNGEPTNSSTQATRESTTRFEPLEVGNSDWPVTDLDASFEGLDLPTSEVNPTSSCPPCEPDETGDEPASLPVGTDQSDHETKISSPVTSCDDGTDLNDQREEPTAEESSILETEDNNISSQQTSEIREQIFKRTTISGPPLSRPSTPSLGSSGFVKHFQAKAILLGDVAAGKTSFLNAMRLQAAKLTPAGADGRTIGIEVHSVDLRGNIRLWFYDFGGHDTYHFSQQLFLSEKAIYIIVVDIAAYKPEKFSKTVEYWYDVLTSCLTQPVICVLATHIDQCDLEQVKVRCADIKQRLEKLEQDHVDVLRAQLSKIEISVRKCFHGDYDKLRDFRLHSLEKPLERINKLLDKRPKLFCDVHCVSSKTMDGIPAVCEQLCRIMVQNGDLFPASYIPQTWLTLADNIVSQRENLPYLCKKQFEESAHALNIKGKNVSLALNYLQSVGVVLHYDDCKKNSELNNYVFNNANLLLAIFGLIFNHNYYLDEMTYLWKNRNMLKIPRFDFERLQTNLKSEAVIGEQFLKCFWEALGIGADIFKAILGLLEKFDLCYEVIPRKELQAKLPEGRHFCFPYLLKESVPARVPLLWKHKTPEDSREYQLCLVFSRPSPPRGFMERISVRMNPYFDSRLDWKKGFVAFCNQAKDIVKVDWEKDGDETALCLRLRTNKGQSSMARHILLIMVAIVNRVLTRQYPGVTAVWFVRCGHCIRLAETRYDVRVDRFPADNVVFAEHVSGDIRCKNCEEGQQLQLADVFPTKPVESGRMNISYLRALRTHQAKLVKQLDAAKILPLMLKRGLVDIHDHELVVKSSPSSLRNQILLELVTKREDAAFLQFLDILQDTEYADLASDLQHAVEAVKPSRDLEDDDELASIVTSDSGMVGSCYESIPRLSPQVSSSRTSPAPPCEETKKPSPQSSRTSPVTARSSEDAQTKKLSPQSSRAITHVARGHLIQPKEAKITRLPTDICDLEPYERPPPSSRQNGARHLPPPYPHHKKRTAHRNSGQGHDTWRHERSHGISPSHDQYRSLSASRVYAGRMPTILHPDSVGRSPHRTFYFTGKPREVKESQV